MKRNPLRITLLLAVSGLAVILWGLPQPSSSILPAIGLERPLMAADTTAPAATPLGSVRIDAIPVLKVFAGDPPPNPGPAPAPQPPTPPTPAPIPAPLPPPVLPVAKLTGASVVQPGAFGFVTTAGSSGCGYLWKVTPPPMQSRLLPICLDDGLHTPAAMIQPQDGDAGKTFTVLFVEWGENHTLDVAAQTITVGGTPPNPPPGPVPPPNPPSPQAKIANGQLYLILYLPSLSQPVGPEYMIPLDGALRAELESRGNQLRVFDPQTVQAVGVPAVYAALFRQAQSFGLPCGLIVDGSDPSLPTCVRDHAALTDAAAALALTKKWEP